MNDFYIRNRIDNILKEYNANGFVINYFMEVVTAIKQRIQFPNDIAIIANESLDIYSDSVITLNSANTAIELTNNEYVRMGLVKHIDFHEYIEIEVRNNPNKEFVPFNLYFIRVTPQY